MIKQSIEADLKKAMLAGEKELVTTLRTIKSVILDAEISTGVRDEGLDDGSIISLLLKETKKRSEAAKIYKDAGDVERCAKELEENKVIDRYLPTMMGENEIRKIAQEIVAGISGEIGMQQMGMIIGQVKAKTGPLADGSLIAKAVKDLISK